MTAPDQVCPAGLHSPGWCGPAPCTTPPALPWCNLPICPELGEHRITTGRCLLIPAAPSEPPAAAQQEEVERAAQAIWADGLPTSMYGRMPWEDIGATTKESYRRMARAALAARPSADTETLRDNELPFVFKLNDQDVTVAEVPDLPERGLTSLTYNYRQLIQVRSVDDLDGRVLLHEVLHALLATDPQQVCPVADPRHEDFVRMLTAGLHDNAGYRRLAARPPDDTASLREAVSTWIDEAPEHTAGLDLLRQIIAADRAALDAR